MVAEQAGWVISRGAPFGGLWRALPGGASANLAGRAGALSGFLSGRASKRCRRPGGAVHDPPSRIAAVMGMRLFVGPLERNGPEVSDGTAPLGEAAGVVDGL